MRAKKAHHVSVFESVGKALSSIHRQRGDAWIDSLGKTGVVLREWRAAIVADLGGEETISAQERVIVEAATRTFLLLESVDRYLLALPSLVNRRRKQLYQVVMQRQQLADSLARNMLQLGLRRRARQVPQLNEYLAQRGGAGGTADKATEMTPEVVVQDEVAPGEDEVHSAKDDVGTNGEGRAQ
jgi:hypothetical protein